MNKENEPGPAAGTSKETMPTDAENPDEPSAPQPQQWMAVQIHLTPPIEGRVGHSIVQTSPTTAYMFGGASGRSMLPEIWEIDMHPANTNAGYRWNCKLLDDANAKFPEIYDFMAVPVSRAKSRAPVAETESGAGAGDHASDGDPMPSPLLVDQVWFFGGGSKDEAAVKNDVLLFDTELKQLDYVAAENEGSSRVPEPRTQGANKCLVEFNGSPCLVIYSGGVKKAITKDCNLYVFNIATKMWNFVDVVGDTPLSRHSHAMASVGSKVFIHGGYRECDVNFNYIQMIDLAAPPYKWTRIESSSGRKPCARFGHNIAAVGQDLYIFGGMGPGAEMLNDLWKFNTETYEWTQIQYIGRYMDPRADFAFGAVRLPDMEQDGLLIHGGIELGGRFFDDLILLKPIPL